MSCEEEDTDALADECCERVWRISLYSFRRRLEPAMTVRKKDVRCEGEGEHRKVALQHNRESEHTRRDGQWVATRDGMQW